MNPGLVDYEIPKWESQTLVEKEAVGYCGAQV